MRTPLFFLALSVFAGATQGQTIQPKLVTPAELKAILDQDRGPILVHFTSDDPGCGPCIESNTGIPDAVAKEHWNHPFLRVSFSPWQNIPSDLPGIQLVGVPTLVVFENGKEVKQSVGYAQAKNAEIVQMLRPFNGATAARQAKAAVSGPPAALLKLSPQKTSMLWGQTFATSVEARDAQGKVMSPTPSLQWTSSADGIATVDNTGRIHTIRRGHTTITAKSGNASASIEVDVTGFSELGQASFETTCAVTDDHLDIYCWGNGANNRITPKHAAKAWHYPSLIQIQLGDIPAGTKITSLMTGTWSTCALTEAGKAYCSGEPNNGLTLGSGDNAAKPVLTAVQNGDIPAGVKTTALASSADNMCATGSDSQLYCWGSTDPLPVNAKTPRFPSLMKPTRMERGDIPQGATLSAIGVGISGGCAIANGEAYCWHLRLAPKLVARGEVPANVKLTDISVTDDITCAAGDDGRAYCLGQAFGRRFGAGKAAFVEAKDWNAVSLGEMPAGVKVKQITVGGIANVSCILGDDHKAYCWGKNTRGSIGNGDQKEADVLEPKQVAQGQVPSDVSLLQITCAQAYCAVLGDDGRIYSWGSSTNDFVLGRAVNLGSSGPQLLNAPLP